MIDVTRRGPPPGSYESAPGLPPPLAILAILANPAWNTAYASSGSNRRERNLDRPPRIRRVKEDVEGILPVEAHIGEVHLIVGSNESRWSVVARIALGPQ